MTSGVKAVGFAPQNVARKRWRRWLVEKACATVPDAWAAELRMGGMQTEVELHVVKVRRRFARAWPMRADRTVWLNVRGKPVCREEVDGLHLGDMLAAARDLGWHVRGAVQGRPLYSFVGDPDLGIFNGGKLDELQASRFVDFALGADKLASRLVVLPTQNGSGNG